MRWTARTVATLEARRARVLSELHPELRGKVERLMAQLGDRVAPWEGYRDEAGQAAAFRNGVSSARWLQSPHNYRPSFACDLVLHPAHVKLRPHRDDKDMPDLWDDATPEAVQVWLDLEGAAKTLGLERVRLKGGRPDLPHVQLPGWRSRVPA